MSELNSNPSASNDDAIFDAATAATFLAQRGDPPPWRDVARRDCVNAAHIVGPREREAIKAAFYLRRPLLVTGEPGTGKSTLAEAVASELNLGKVLTWPITSRTTLQQGLYSYDAVGRLQQSSQTAPEEKEAALDIGRFIRLEALGTALYSSEPQKPRVLLIDELDKSDVDLPNDLLHVLEKGEFLIQELGRYSKEIVKVRVVDSEQPVPVGRGMIKAQAAPFVVMTSNGEREFPPAFLRRCLRLDIDRPGDKALKKIVRQKLGNTVTDTQLTELVKAFLEIRDSEHRVLATDQLLNAAFLVSRGLVSTSRAELEDVVFRALSETPRSETLRPSA